MDLVRIVRDAISSYFVVQLHDPVTLVMVFHMVCTFVHFVTWASTYGGVGGSGPDKVRTGKLWKEVWNAARCGRGRGGGGRLEVLLLIEVFPDEDRALMALVS